jgi:hypothetical protein
MRLASGEARARAVSVKMRRGCEGESWAAGARRARPVNLTGPPRASPLDGPGQAIPDGPNYVAQPDTANGSG